MQAPTSDTRIAGMLIRSVMSSTPMSGLMRSPASRSTTLLARDGPFNQHARLLLWLSPAYRASGHCGQMGDSEAARVAALCQAPRDRRSDMEDEAH